MTDALLRVLWRDGRAGRGAQVIVVLPPEADDGPVFERSQRYGAALCGELSASLGVAVTSLACAREACDA